MTFELLTSHFISSPPIIRCQLSSCVPMVTRWAGADITRSNHHLDKCLYLKTYLLISPTISPRRSWWTRILTTLPTFRRSALSKLRLALTSIHNINHFLYSLRLPAISILSTFYVMELATGEGDPRGLVDDHVHLWHHWENQRHPWRLRIYRRNVRTQSSYVKNLFAYRIWSLFAYFVGFCHQMRFKAKI